MQIGIDDTRVAAIKFGNDAEVQFYLDDHSSQEEVFKAIDKIVFTEDNTNTASALETLSTEVLVPARGERPDVNNMIIVFTDGRSTINNGSTVTKAVVARNEGSNIFVAGVTDQVYLGELKGIASPPQEEKETYWTLDTFSDLDSEKFVNSLVASMCSFHRRLLCKCISCWDYAITNLWDY